MSKQFDNFMKLKKAAELIMDVQDDLKNDKLAKQLSADITALMVIEYSFLKKPIMEAAKEMIKFAEMMPDETNEKE